LGANLSRASKQENVSTTLSSGITDVAVTMDVTNATQLNYPSYLVIDRVDASGTLKSTSLWEYVKVTNIVGNTLTITRAQGGSTGQAHSSGAVVEAVMTAALQEEYYAAFNPEHTATGGHVMSAATIANLTNGLMAVTSMASIYILHISNSLNVSGASVSGLGLNPTWFISSIGTSGANVGKPMAMPRGGAWKFVNVTLSGNSSSPSVYFDINKNFASIFATGTRPKVAGGTFVSTASIATQTFNQGDVFNVDLDFAGNDVAATVTLAGR